MTSRSRTRRLLAPIFKRHADVFYADQYLVVGPVRHVFRGIILDASSIKGYFRPRWAVTHLFQIWTAQGLDGFVFEPEDFDHDSFYSSPDAEMSEVLCNKIESTTLPFLRSIDTVASYYAWAMGKEDPIALWPDRHLRLELAMGRFAEARTIADKWREWWSKDPYHFDALEFQTLTNTRKLCALLDASDIAGIAACLHEWEGITAKNFKLDHVWQPTPFPFEDGYRTGRHEGEAPGHWVRPNQ